MPPSHKWAIRCTLPMVTLNVTLCHLTYMVLKDDKYRENDATNAMVTMFNKLKILHGRSQSTIVADL